MLTFSQTLTSHKSLKEGLWLSEWAHHSDHDREPGDWQPEEEDRGRQDEAGNRDKGNWFSSDLLSIK